MFWFGVEQAAESGQPPGPACPTDPSPQDLETLYGATEVREAKSFWNQTPRSWKVETAVTPHARSRGMMYRVELKADSGILFVFDELQIRSFWMKNTCVPLDLVFLSDVEIKPGSTEPTARILGVVTAEPLTLRSRSIREPARFVLEIAAGEAQKRGWGPGTELVLGGQTPLGRSPVKP